MLKFDGCTKAFKQEVRCNQKGLQRLREFVLSGTQLCSAESFSLCSQITNFRKIRMRSYSPPMYGITNIWSGVQADIKVKIVI